MGRLVSGAVALFAALYLTVAAQAQVICISNNVPPPELPVYDQPPIPAPGYIWTPGYWAAAQAAISGFREPGLSRRQSDCCGRLDIGAGTTASNWTAGYWGPHVGFYGGVNYGFGYIGTGYEGGRWNNGVFCLQSHRQQFRRRRLSPTFMKRPWS